jgi:hypothetical protein
MLCTGMLERPSNELDELQDALDNKEEFEESKLIKGSIPQYQYMLETLKKRSTMAIRDDY